MSKNQDVSAFATSKATPEFLTARKPGDDSREAAKVENNKSKTGNDNSNSKLANFLGENNNF